MSSTLDDRVRTVLGAISEEVRPATDLTDRVRVGVVRRRRRVRATAAVAVAVTVTLVGTAVTLDAVGPERSIAPADPSGPPLAAAAHRVGPLSLVSYTRYREGPDDDLRADSHLLRPDGETYRTVPYGWAEVSPDRTTAAVLDIHPIGEDSSRPTTRRLGLLDLRDNRPVEWIALPRDVASAYWSPDGTRILATTYDGVDEGEGEWAKGSRTGFVVVDTASRKSRFVPLPTGSEAVKAVEDVDVGTENMLWTPDGTGVFGTDVGRNAVTFHSLDGRLRRTLTGVVLGESVGAAPISPDGQWMLVGRRTTPGPYPDVTGILDVRTGRFLRALTDEWTGEPPVGSTFIGSVSDWLDGGQVLAMQARYLGTSDDEFAMPEYETRVVIVDTSGRVTGVASSWRPFDYFDAIAHRQYAWTG